MLKARDIILELALFLAMTGELLGQSQRPSPGATDQGSPQQPSPKNNQQATQPDLRGTQQAPFIIRNSKGNEESAKDERDRQDKAFNDHVTIFLSAFVAISTSLQAIALFMIIRTTRRQLRAYVFVTEVKIMKLPGRTEPSILVQFTNTGQTPAYKLTILADKKVDEYPLMANPFSGPDYTRVGSLGAGLHSHVELTGFSLTERERQETENWPFMCSV
jgi:hypothetical protein